MTIVAMLGAALLVCLGMLLGASWTLQATQSNLRRQAEERRRLSEERLAVRTARRRQGKCLRCASALSVNTRYVVPTIIEDWLDDDD
jgi:hypothetical protein